MSIETKTHDGTVTVREAAQWLASLPEEWQEKEFCSVLFREPMSLKRLVALKSKDGSFMGVAANPMGTHLPFDDSYEWVYSLS